MHNRNENGNDSSSSAGATDEGISAATESDQLTRTNGSITVESSARLSVAQKLYEPLPGIMIPTSHPRPVISILEQ